LGGKGGKRPIELERVEENNYLSPEESAGKFTECALSLFSERRRKPDWGNSSLELRGSQLGPVGA